MATIMKRIIIITLFVTFIIPLSPGKSFAYLTPAADGTYYNEALCSFWINEWTCDDSWSIIGDEIAVQYDKWNPFPIEGAYWEVTEDGIIEFDISSMEGLFTSGQIQATLFLKVRDREYPDGGDRCFIFNSITDLEENGVIEEGDINTTDYIGEVCENFQHGDMITIDVTSALEHDLFSPAQTDFSGFVIERATNWYDRISFYNRSTANNPSLCIKDIGASDDLDGDCIADDTDNCNNTPNPFQEDTYPPQGNGIGDACDCECDFNCTGGVDAIDVASFLTDFGRNQFFNPCTNISTCNGDFNCDVNVDAADVTIFLTDFGRNQFNNPCPTCVTGAWCEYP